MDEFWRRHKFSQVYIRADALQSHRARAVLDIRTVRTRITIILYYYTIITVT